MNIRESACHRAKRTFPCSRTSKSDPNDESQGHMQGTASKTSERVNEARPQKSSRQKTPCDFVYIAGSRECRQALREVQPAAVSKGLVWSSLVLAASRTCFSTSPKAVMRSRDGSPHSALVANDFLRSSS